MRLGRCERYPTPTTRRTIALYALMWSLTAAACALIALAYFGYRGTALPRIPARIHGDWLMERDDEMGFAPVRNGAVEIEQIGDLRYRVFTDARRARVDAAGMQTPPHVDVLTIGCSFTWGAGIASEQTYTQQLGRILGVPVANFGMGSFGSVQAYQTLVRNVDLRPKVVVYGFIADHVRRNVSPCAPNLAPYCLPVSYLEREGAWVKMRPPRMEYFTPEDNRAFNMEVVMRDPAGLRSWLLGAKWAAKIAWFRYRNPKTIAVDDTPETANATMLAIVSGMLEQAQHIGARLVVLHMPYLRRGHVAPPPEALVQAIAGKDLTFVDFAPVAAAFYERDLVGTLVLGQEDAHPNAAAHRLIAETLAPAVRPWLEAQAVRGPPAP